MQRDHLSALELGYREGHYLEHPPDGVPQSCHEVVQNKFRKVCCQPGVILQFSDVSGCLRRTAPLSGLTGMRFESLIDVSSKYAVGPSGR